MTGRSEKAVADALSAVLRDQGWPTALNPKRLRASMNDVLGVEADQHRGALDAVVLAVEEGIVAHLHTVGRQDGGALLPGMVDRLTEWGPSRDRATWALRTWVDRIPEATLPPPATEEPPATREAVVAPTTLPPADTAPSRTPLPAPARTIAPPAAPSDPVGVTALPPARERQPASLSKWRLGARGPVAAAVAAAVLLVGVVVAAVAWPDGPERTRLSAGDASSESDDSASPSSPPPPPPAAAGTVAAIGSARVPDAGRHVAMGSRTAGVRVPRVGEVETVEIDAEQHSAPEGGHLIAFRLADWPCEGDACRPWQRLGLRVKVGKDERPLPRPEGDDTFVVAVPAGVSDVQLVMRADGLRQAVSLVTGAPSDRNVAVLARRGRVDRIGKRFTLVERTSQAFDYGDRVTDTVPRLVSVTRAKLQFFTAHGRPASPRRAYLKIGVQYTIPYGASAGEPYAFELREISFVARDGTRYQARDIDEGPGIDAVFEVPATLQGGTFHMGGGSYVVSSDGLTFTRTLAGRSIPIRFD